MARVGPSWDLLVFGELVANLPRQKLSEGALLPLFCLVRSTVVGVVCAANSGRQLDRIRLCEERF